MMIIRIVRPGTHDAHHFNCPLQPLPVVEEASKDADARSLYVSPFPYNTTLDALTGEYPKGAHPVSEGRGVNPSARDS